MKNITTKQQNDIDVSKYFIPKGAKDTPITDEDVAKYFKWSDHGEYKEEATKASYVAGRRINGFEALVLGKRWRGVHVEMYEDGVLEGTMPYVSLLVETEQAPRTPIPHCVVNFLRKEMFKGRDSSVIENCYQYILEEVSVL